MHDVTIGFVPRERFSLAAEALQRIFDSTDIPFKLIVVDCNTPQQYRREMETVLDGRDNVTVLRTDHYLRPNQSKNLVLAHADGEYLCMIENDCLVQEGWLSLLIAACEEHPADVAVPLIMEGPLGTGTVHFDDLLGHIEAIDTPDGPKLAITQRTGNRQHDRGSQRRRVEFMENHCLLFRRSVFDAIGAYDEALNTRDEVDLSLALYHAGKAVVYEPACEVHYLPPYPPNPDETEYFRYKWDLGDAAASRRRIEQKWDLVALPGDLEFVKDRLRIGQLHQVHEDLARLSDERGPLILVDQGQWLGSDIVEGVDVIPFPERDGQYWGAPADDEEALAELERLQTSGAGAIAFAWPAYWWLEHYTALARHLDDNYQRVVSNDRLTVFDLR